MFWAAGLVSMVLAYFTTRLAIGLSVRFGALDTPNKRSSHFDPTPRLGGMGILASAGVTYAGFILLGNFHVFPYPTVSPEKLAMLGAGLAMAATGLYDDLHPLRPGIKLVGQFVLASVIAGLGYHVDTATVPGWGSVSLGWLSIPLTILWLTGFSNTFNFMDGINGMAAVTAVVNFLFLALLAWLLGMPALVVLIAIFAGSCMGFLPHNFPRAKTFMGDVGSLPLGFTLAFLVVHLSQESADPEAVPALLLVFSVSLWDTGFTLLCRILRGENILQSHRQHLYQRLVQLGYSHAKITCLYLVLHLVMGCMALAYSWWAPEWRHLIIAVVLVILGTLTIAVYWLEYGVNRTGGQEKGNS